MSAAKYFFPRQPHFDVSLCLESKSYIQSLLSWSDWQNVNFSSSLPWCQSRHPKFLSFLLITIYSFHPDLFLGSVRPRKWLFFSINGEGAVRITTVKIFSKTIFQNLPNELSWFINQLLGNLAQPSYPHCDLFWLPSAIEETVNKFPEIKFRLLLSGRVLRGLC